MAINELEQPFLLTVVSVRCLCSTLQLPSCLYHYSHCFCREDEDYGWRYLSYTSDAAVRYSRFGATAFSPFTASPSRAAELQCLDGWLQWIFTSGPNNFDTTTERRHNNCESGAVGAHYLWPFHRYAHASDAALKRSQLPEAKSWFLGSNPEGGEVSPPGSFDDFSFGFMRENLAVAKTVTRAAEKCSPSAMINEQLLHHYMDINDPSGVLELLVCNSEKYNSNAAAFNLAASSYCLRHFAMANGECVARMKACWHEMAFMFRGSNTCFLPYKFLVSA